MQTKQLLISTHRSKWIRIILLMNHILQIHTSSQGSDTYFTRSLVLLSHESPPSKVSKPSLDHLPICIDHIFQYPVHHTSLFIRRSDSIPFHSPFHPSSFLSFLFILDSPDGTSKTFIMKGIQHLVDLCSKWRIAVAK